MTNDERFDALANTVDRIEAALRHQTNILSGIGERLIGLENKVETLEQYVASDSLAKNNEIAGLARHQQGVDVDVLRAEALSRRIANLEQRLLLADGFNFHDEGDVRDKVRERMFGQKGDDDAR